MFAWSASKMLPTAMVGMPTTFRTRSENGVCHMRPYTGFCQGTVCPLERSRRSAPAAFIARPIAISSSSVSPPGAQSLEESRTESGRSGQAARTAARTSSG